jgi:hypothetical protein
MFHPPKFLTCFVNFFHYYSTHLGFSVYEKGLSTGHFSTPPRLMKTGFFRQVMNLKIQRKNPGGALLLQSGSPRFQSVRFQTRFMVHVAV